MNETLVSQYTNILDQMKCELQNLMVCLQHEREEIIEFNVDKIKERYHEKNEILRKIEALESAQLELKAVMSASWKISGVLSTEKILASIQSPIERESIAEKISCIKSITLAVKELNEMQRDYLRYSINDVECSIRLIDRISPQQAYACYDRHGTFRGESFPVSTRSMKGA